MALVNRRGPQFAGALAALETYNKYAPAVKRKFEEYSNYFNAMKTRSGRRYRVALNRFNRNVRPRGYRSARGGVAARAGVRSGQGVTVQHDARSIYRKKRAPRSVRKRWRRFCRKIHAVAEKDFGTRTVVFNKTQAFTNTSSSNHGLAYCSLYSLNGTGDSFMQDLYNMAVLENLNANPTAAAGITVNDSTKWLFQSGILDVTFRNSSTYNQAGVQVASADAKLEVDVYELLSNRDWTDQSGPFSDITSCFARGATQTLNLGGAGTGVTLPARGVTPWDLPYALSYFRLKILKKTKYFVNNNDTFTYQIRDPKRRVIMQDRMDSSEGGNLVKWSRHLLVIFKLVPGLSVGAGVGQYTESLTVGMTRKYMYKIEGANEDRDRLLQNT